MKIKHSFTKILTIFICNMFLAISVCGCTLPGSEKNQSVQKTIIAYDTVVTITLYGTTDSTILEEAATMCTSYEQLFSRTIEGSDVYRINHSNGKPVTVDPETLLLIKESIRFSELTNGSIDITIAPVRDLWDFTDSDMASSDPQGFIPPCDDALKKALSHVDYHCIQYDESASTVMLTDPQAQIDLGFIAKGYIADKIKEFLLSNGIESAIINLGGNVVTVGSKPDGTPFQIGVEKPFDTTTTLDILTVSDRSVVTSGIYQRYATYQDKIYHHILDPKTGYPASGDLLSVTILSDSSMIGDALSTSCLLLGAEESKQLLANFHNTEAIFVTSDYQIIKWSQP
ncbi:MAG: FAD:protein FMN transferase [Lachnospiraceae bacterium]|nr:FAD:protein FMN transferase [Lachnospiraceae bacterium]